MTRKELSNAIHERIGLSKRESSQIVGYFFNLLKDEFLKSGEIKLPRFGSFYVKERKPRKGRNPSTGETIEIASRKVIVFKPSRLLRDTIDNKRLNDNDIE